MPSGEDQPVPICPKCEQPMALSRIVPRTAEGPEQRVYLCRPCNETLTFSEADDEGKRDGEDGNVTKTTTTKIKTKTKKKTKTKTKTETKTKTKTKITTQINTKIRTKTRQLAGRN